MKPFLEVRHVYFSYPDGTPALHDISMEVLLGSKVAVLGPNGAGKSTLFLHLNGILRPREGFIAFNGQPVTYRRKELLELKRRVGLVFQNPDTQIFTSDVVQEVSFGPLNLGISRDEAARRVERALAVTDLTDLRDRPTHSLSYGQKKRLAVADILAMEPDVLVFDEPTAWLDPGHARQLMRLLDELSRQGKTIIFSTHDVNMAHAWADHIYVLVGGRMAVSGPPDSIWENGSFFEQADLYRPWIIELQEALQEKGWLSNEVVQAKTKEELLRMIRLS